MPLNARGVPLTDDKRNTMRSIYQNVKVILLDEVSMIGYKVWTTLNSRLQEHKQISALFGGLHVIAIGDFFQLPPVMDKFLLYNSGAKNLNNLTINPWIEFQMMELTEIMRQKDDHKFAEQLNRLREARHSDEDISNILTRQLPPHVEHNQQLSDDERYDIFLPHLFFQNETVERHNDKVYDEMMDAS